VHVLTHSGLGSLSTLQDFYIGMKRKERPVDVSGSSSTRTQFAGVAVSMSSPKSDVAVYPKSVTDIDQTSGKQATTPSVCSMSHTLPVFRSISRITHPQKTSALSAMKPCPGRADQSFVTDRFNSSNLIAGTAPGANATKIPALDNDQPSTLKKRKLVQKSAKINTEVSGNQNTLSENGAKECSDEITVGKVMIVENGTWSPTKVNTGYEQVTPTGEIQIQSKA